MGELLKTIRLAGPRSALRLLRGYRLGMQGIIRGYYTTRVVQALSNVGVLDEMEAKGSVDPESFARTHDLDANVLKALCDALFSSRIFKKGANGYALDSKGRVLVGAPRCWFKATYGYEEVLHSLEALLRREKRYGKDVERRIESVAEGYGEMQTLVYVPWLLEIMARNGFRRVLDLGCGDGALLRTLCERRRDVTGHGVDRSPEVIAAGKRKVEAAGLGSRIELHVGDISRLDQVPEAQAEIDVATAVLVLHELLYWGGDGVVESLRGFRAMFPGVPLVVFEVVKATPEELRRRPGMGIVYFLHHDLTHQKPVSREEWRDLFRKAGFDSIEEIDLWFTRTVIFTLR